MNSDQCKIFVINLKRSEDRRKEIMQKFAEYDIQYEFFDAVDGSLLPQGIIDEARARSNHWYHQDWGLENSMKIGEIGVAMSHSKIYKKIISENLPSAIIMEDDATFDFRLRHLVNSKVDTLMVNFDLVLLGYCESDLDYKKKGECSYWRRIKINKAFEAGIPVEWCWSAIGYLISKKGAALLLEKQGEIPSVTADILTANSPKYGVRLGVLRNKIIWPGEFSKYSTIQFNQENHGVDQKQEFSNNAKKESSKKKFPIKSVFAYIIWYLRKQKIKLAKKPYQFTIDRY